MRVFGCPSNNEGTSNRTGLSPPYHNEPLDHSRVLLNDFSMDYLWISPGNHPRITPGDLHHSAYWHSRSTQQVYFLEHHVHEANCNAEAPNQEAVLVFCDIPEKTHQRTRCCGHIVYCLHYRGVHQWWQIGVTETAPHLQPWSYLWR